jgi:integrase
MPVRRDTRTGDWFFRSVIKLPDGTRRRVYGTPGVPGPYHDLARTKAGAHEAERRAVARALTGASGAPARTSAAEVPTIREYATAFQDEYAAEHKPSERRSKEQILRSHVLPFIGELRLDELTVAHVKRFAAQERKRGCAVKTVNNRLAVLSSLVKYAVRNRVVADPGIAFQVDGELKGSKPPAVPMEDVERLLAAATDERHRVVVLLGAEAGLRAGEMRGLQLGDFADGKFTVRRALDTETDEVIAPKHDKVRTVPVSDRLANALAALPKRGLWVVSRLDGGCLTHSGLYDAVVDLYDRAGVTRPPMPLHCLRHTFGTEAAAAGVPLPVLKELMGHADIKTTMRYVDVSDRQKREAIAAAFGRGSHVAAVGESHRKLSER